MEIIHDIYRNLVGKYQSFWMKIYLHLQDITARKTVISFVCSIWVWCIDWNIKENFPLNNLGNEFRVFRESTLYFQTEYIHKISVVLTWCSWLIPILLKHYNWNWLFKICILIFQDGSLDLLKFIRVHIPEKHGIFRNDISQINCNYSQNYAALFCVSLGYAGSGTVRNAFCLLERNLEKFCD
jgi:hypothetical protein